MIFPFKITSAFLLIFSLSFCASRKEIIIFEKVKKKEEKKEIFLSPEGGIVLQKHQKETIDYLYKNKKQKGLLINHYMGSGKTI